MLSLRSGETFVGEKVTIPTTARDLTIPLALRDAYEAIQSEGWGKGSVLTALTMMGMGLSTYVAAGPKTREVRKLAYEAEQAHADNPSPQTRAEQAHYDSIERTLKIYDAAANKLRTEGQQNSSEAKDIRRKQEQLAAIALDGGRIWATAKPNNAKEFKLAVAEALHKRIQDIMAGKTRDWNADYKERAAIAKKAIEQGFEGFKIKDAAEGTVKGWYTEQQWNALEAGDMAAFAQYIVARRALLVYPGTQKAELTEKFAGLIKNADADKKAKLQRQQAQANAAFEAFAAKTKK